MVCGCAISAISAISQQPIPLTALLALLAQAREGKTEEKIMVDYLKIVAEIEAGMARMENIPTDKRPREIWYAVNAINAVIPRAKALKALMALMA